MDASSLHTAILRLSLLDAAEAVAGGVKLSRSEHARFDADPVHFYSTECGPARRAQIFALIEPPRRTVPIGTELRDVA